MLIGPVILDGHHARLEPVSLAHVPALWRAGEPNEIWRYLSSTVRSEEEMRCYVASELAKQEAGLVVRFTTVAKATDQPVGSTSDLNIDRHHRRAGTGWSSRPTRSTRSRGRHWRASAPPRRAPSATTCSCPMGGFVTASISASPTTNGPASRRISKGSCHRTRPRPPDFPLLWEDGVRREGPRGFLPIHAPRTDDARRVVADDRITRPAHIIMTASSDNSRRTTP